MTNEQHKPALRLRAERVLADGSGTTQAWDEELVSADHPDAWAAVPVNIDPEAETEVSL